MICFYFTTIKYNKKNLSNKRLNLLKASSYQLYVNNQQSVSEKTNKKKLLISTFLKFIG